MAILSFRKLISSIFIFLSVAGLLFTVFGLITGTQDSMLISKIFVYGIVLGVAYYFGYVYKSVSGYHVNKATCDALVAQSSSSSSNTNSQSTDSQHSDQTISSETTSDGNQVFNISNNVFRYDQAKSACKKFDAELATVDQIKDAYRKGANWCNYGWTQGGYALYPIQPGYFSSIQSNPKCKWSCGSKPGLVGGLMDSNYTLGVNCYGKPPQHSRKNILKCQQESAEADNLINNLSAEDLMVNSFN